MNQTISVIVPVYNVETYIGDCLTSILNQTVPFDEIILVNDGSTDGSGSICREYQSAHPEIILIEQENMGLSEARNSGMRKATGDYIVFIDSDDWVSVNMCEVIKRTLAAHPVEVVYYASELVKEIPVKISQEAYRRDEEFANRVMKGFDSLKKFFPADYQMSSCMAAYKFAFLKGHNIDFIRGIVYEDRFFSLRVITEADEVIYITDKLYSRRLRATSICTSPASNKKIRDVIYGHQREWQYIRNNEKWKKEKALTQYYALCGAIMAYQSDVSSMEMKKEREEYLLAFLKEWLNYFSIDCMGVNELCELLIMLKNVAKSDRQEVNSLFDIYGGIDAYQERVRELLMVQYRERLRKLPFEERKRIALYGAGEHTNCLLRLYQELVGEIKAELTLIVSDEKDVNPVSEITMQSIAEITDCWDIYVLSSGIYWREMQQNLWARKIPQDKICRLYDRNDAVDCVMVYQALFE